MRRVSMSVIAGVLAVAGLTLTAGSAQAQHRHHGHHHHQGNVHGQHYYAPPVYVAPAIPWQASRYDGCNDYGYNAYSYQRPHYDAYRNGSYYAPAQNFSFGYQNRDFGLYIRR
jgi:hypothetical protein